MSAIFSKPKSPKMPAQPPPPNPDDPMMVAEKQRKKTAAAYDRKDTILTGSMGLASAAPVARKVLLGG